MLGIFLDTETNGLDPFIHQVLEIAFKIVDLKTGALLDAYQAIVYQPVENWQRSDPASLAVNGLKWEELQNGKEKGLIAKEIENLFAKHGIVRGKAVFICQNPSFDRPFFAKLIQVETQEKKLWPYHWLDLASMQFTAMLLKKKQDPIYPWPWEIGLSKDVIAKANHLPPEEKPHRAMNGVNHLLLCYEAVIGFPMAAKISS